MATVTIPKKLNNEMKSFILASILEVLNDSDFGLELTAQAKRRLRASLKEKNTVPFSEIKKRHS